MLFSSWIFVAVFLPICWGVFQYLQRNASLEVAFSWLVAASLFFYGWFKPAYVLIILASILFNFSIGTLLAKKRMRKVNKNRLLGFGVAGNLLALGYYKYAGFFMETLNAVGGTYSVPQIVLPLAISFFTFQQIAYLVDAYRGETEEFNFRHYTLFVTFFPQLIAGPIVHHKEMIPQFMKRGATKINWEMLALGITVFIIGLFKKVGIADYMAEMADPVFAAAAFGIKLSFFEAWLGTVAYTLQIYFDFSGYSDMAIGLAAMFGIRLPLNFFSPYKATNIIDFWRRWHITLSRFLRDYLYIPLGGNRKGKFRRLTHLMITMLLGGLWHGANWTFVIWGGLHGVYLMINHLWQQTGLYIPRVLAQTLTLLAVMVAWVFFRADSIDTALYMLDCMTNKYGVAVADKASLLGQALDALGIDVRSTNSKLLRHNEKWHLLASAVFVALFAPTTHEFIKKKLALDITKVADKVKAGRVVWAPTLLWGSVLAFMAMVSMLLLTRVNAFIYFQF